MGRQSERGAPLLHGRGGADGASSGSRFLCFSVGDCDFQNADSLRALALRVPDDRLLIETDAPYLAPVPNRGQTNEPAFLRHTAEFLAQLKGMDFASFAAMTTGKCREAFSALFCGLATGL